MQFRFCTAHARDRGCGVSYPGSATFGAPAVAHNYKVHLNAPLRRKIQKLSPQMGPARMFPRVTLWLSTGMVLHSDVYC